MSKKVFWSVVCLILILLSSNVQAYDVVIDPGHGGDEQNRGGPAFTVSDMGSELDTAAYAGDNYIFVNEAKHFSLEDGYETILVNGDQYQIQTDTSIVPNPIDYESGRIVIEGYLTSTYDTGASVTVQDFLVQAMGRYTDGSDPGDWDPAAKDYDTLAYTHQVPANQWQQWKRKINDDGDSLGLLEVLNTWEISKRLEDILDDDHTVVKTKNGVLEEPNFQSRGQTTVGGEEPDYFISIHTNGGASTARGAVYVPYRTPAADGTSDGTYDSHTYHWTNEPPSSVWPPSHPFNVEWYVDDEFTTPVVTMTGGDTPVLLKDHTYYAKISEAMGYYVEPTPLRYQILKEDGSTWIGSTQATVGELTTVSGDRQNRADSYTFSFTPSDTGTAFTELRGPFQADQQDSMGTYLVNAIRNYAVSNRSEVDINCSDFDNEEGLAGCDLALGSWVADVNDNSEPAFSLVEGAFHSSPEDQEFLISGGYDTIATAVGDSLPEFPTLSANQKYAAGKEADNPHPLRSVEIGHRGNMMNINTGGLIDGVFKIFMEYLGGSPTVSTKPKNRNSSYFIDAAYASWLVDPSSADYIDSGPGDGAGIQIRPFEPGWYDVSIEQMDTDTLSCPGDWDKFYSDRDMSAVDLTFNEYVEGEPYIHKNYKLAPQSRLDGAVYDSRTLEPLENVQVTVVGNSVKGTKTGESGRFYVCGVDATESTITMAPDSYTIYVNADGYKAEELSGLTIDSGVIQWADTVYLEPENLTHVHGEVINSANNEGRKGFEISFNYAGSPSDTFSKTLVANNNGTYAIDLPAGDYVVEIIMPDEEVGANDIDFKDDTFTITVPGSSVVGYPPEYEKNFYMDPYGKIHGDIVDSWSGDAVKDATVEIYADSDGSLVDTDISKWWGYASGNLTNGDYDVYGYKESDPDVGSDTVQNVTVTEGEISTANLELGVGFTGFYGKITRAFDSQPLGNVEITASPLFTGGVSSTVESSDDPEYLGKYRTDPLDTGNYEVTFHKEDYVDMSITRKTYSDSPVRADIKLQAQPVNLIVDVSDSETGASISGASVQWEHQNLSLSGVGSTASDGTFVKGDVHWGTYALTVTHSAYDTATTTVFLDVGSDTVQSVELQELPDVHVYVEEYGSSVPVNSATVNLKQGGSVEQTSLTGSDGQAKLTNLQLEDYNISVQKSNYKTVEKSVSPSVMSKDLYETFVLRPYGWLEGTVSDSPAGSSIGGASVKLYEDDSLITQTTTSSTGYYITSDVLVGDYRLEVNASNYEQKNIDPVTIDDSGTVQNVKLLRQGRLKGTVVDTGLSIPVGNALVEVVDGSNTVRRSTHTDSAGYYRFEAVPYGNMTVRVSKTGYITQSRALSVTNDDTHTRDFYLTGIGKIDGRVLNFFSDSGVYQASVNIYQSGSQVAGPNLTNSSGEFTEFELNSGHYLLKANSDSYLSNEIPVTNYTAKTDSYIIKLKPYRDVEIHVENLDTTKPAEFIDVYLSDGTDTRTRGTGSDGVAVFENVEPLKNYSILTEHDSVPKTFYLSADTSIPKVVSDEYLPPPEGYIAGQMTDYFNVSEGISGQVTVFTAGDSLVGGPQNAASDGSYERFGLAPGTYRVEFAADNYLGDSAVVDVTDDDTTVVDAGLKPYRDVRVHLTNKETGNNAQDIEVALEGDDFTLYKNTNFSGTTVFSSIEPLNSYTVSVEDGTTPTDFTLEASTDAPYVIEEMYIPPPEGTLVTLVKDRFTGSEIGSADVTIKDEAGVTVATGSSGSSFVLMEGDYDFKANKTNYVKNSTSVTVEGDNTDTYTVKLKPYRDIKVHVEKVGGGAASGVNVDLSGNGYNMSDNTNYSGNAFFNNLPPSSSFSPSSSYNINVTNGSSKSVYLATASYDGQILETVNATYDPPPGTVAGQIVDYCGGGVYRPDAELYQSGSMVAGPESHNDGSFSFTVDAGGYTLKGSRSSYKTNSKSVSISGGHTTNTNLTLRPYDREIKVHVTNTETHKNAQGVSVTVSGGGISKSKDTGWGFNSGIAVFYDLMPGYSYTVSVTNGSTGIVSLGCGSDREEIALTYTPPDS